MTPETARMLLHAYIDGEIDAASTIELESQIEASPPLRQEMERLSALHHVVQTRATRFNAPSRLSKSLCASFPDAQAGSIPSGVSAWWRTFAIGTTPLLLWHFYSGVLVLLSSAGHSRDRHRGGRQRPYPFSDGGSSDRFRVGGAPFGQAVALQPIGFRTAGTRICQRTGLCSLVLDWITLVETRRRQLSTVIGST